MIRLPGPAATAAELALPQPDETACDDELFEKSGSAGEGVTVAKAKAINIPKKSGFMVKGAGGNLTLPTPYSGSLFFNVDTSLTVQTLNSVGTCWTTEFTPATTKKNTATAYKGVAKQ